MGFSVGFCNIATPRVLLHSASAMAYAKNKTLCFLSGLGLSAAPEEESYLRQELPEISAISSSSSSSGKMIKQRLPVIKFRDVAEKLIEISEDFVCAICLRSFGQDDEIRELCNCCHIFHTNCLDKWIDNDEDTCPFCRRPLLPAIESVDQTQMIQNFGRGANL